MSLTLARLCGEWQLASGKYKEVQSGKTKYSRYEYFDNIEEIGRPLRKIRKPLRKVEIRRRNRKAVEEDFLGFLGNRKAIEEIGKPLKKVSRKAKPLKKSESRFRKRKTVEELGKPLKKIFLDFLEMRKPLKKIEL